MELIIFDVDGTLVHSGKRDSMSFAQAYEAAYGRPFPSIDWRHYPHVTDTTIFGTVIREHFQREFAEAERQAFLAAYMELLRRNRQQFPHHFLEVPGARAAVEALAASGRLVGVGTGGWRAPAELKLQHVGISVERQLISGADGQDRREGIIEAVVQAAETLNGGPLSRVVYVGDATWDVQTTRNLQMDFVGVRLQGDTEVLKQAGAEYVVKDYLDFEAFQAALELARPPILKDERSFG